MRMFKRLRAEPASIRVFPLLSRLGATARPPKARTGLSTTATDPCVARGNAVRKGLSGTSGWVAASVAILLSGCATHTLTRSCLTAAQYEQMKGAEPAKVHDKLTGQADADIRPITGSAIELRSWGEAELGLLSICASDPNKP
jgi:hypothetical protein